MILNTFIAFGYVDYFNDNKCFITEEYYQDILRDRERINKKVITYDDVKKEINNIMSKKKQSLIQKQWEIYMDIFANGGLQIQKIMGIRITELRSING